MRIAVASEGLEVSPNFSRCSSFMCYKIARGVIVECQNMPNPHLPEKSIASILGELDVHALVTGSIDHASAAALNAAGIEVATGAKGAARKAAEAYLAHTLTEAEEEGFSVLEA